MAPPNIVLFCVDQWRGDCLGIDGHAVVSTPYLDRLALDGVRFSRAYSAVPSCIAARASLMTGLTPRAHGRVGYRDGVPWNYGVTLAGEFTRHGYQTQAIGKMHVYPERSQLGFQNVILHDGYLHFGRDRRRGPAATDDYLPWLWRELGRPADYFEHGLNCNSVVARPWDKPEHLHPTGWVVHQGIDFLRRRDPRKPFFLLLSFHRPHPPYDPPAWAFEMYLDQPMPPPPVGDWTAIFAPFADPFRPDAAVGPAGERTLRRARAGYYGHMSHIDQQINRFIEVLQEHRLHESTWFCFVSDHGELMGDHHLFRKSLPYEGSARIPLILAGPRDAGLRRGAALDPLVELRDVMPTLLDCAGLPAAEGVEGRSFLPFARGETPPWREFLHGEHTVGQPGGAVHWIVEGDEKYIWFSQTGREQLFDLRRDPGERHDLAPTPAAAGRLENLRRRLAAELAGREEGFSDGRRLIAGRPVSPCLATLSAGGG
jgi:arylsulfatase